MLVIFQIEPRRFGSGLGLQIARALAWRRPGRLRLRDRRSARSARRSGSVVVRLGSIAWSVRACHAPVVGRLIRARIDLEQQVALVDDLAFLEIGTTSAGPGRGRSPARWRWRRTVPMVCSTTVTLLRLRRGDATGARRHRGLRGRRCQIAEMRQTTNASDDERQPRRQISRVRELARRMRAGQVLNRSRDRLEAYWECGYSFSKSCGPAESRTQVCRWTVAPGSARLPATLPGHFLAWLRRKLPVRLRVYLWRIAPVSRVTRKCQESCRPAAVNVTGPAC